MYAIAVQQTIKECSGKAARTYHATSLKNNWASSNKTPITQQFLSYTFIQGGSLHTL